MAEAMARKYGSDVIVAYSAGTSPALQSHATTRAVLAETNIDLGDHMPRRFADLNPKTFDIVVNMSGSRLPGVEGVPLETWEVEDPMGRSDETFRRTRDQIEMLVMRLILRIRAGKFDSRPATSRQ